KRGAIGEKADAAANLFWLGGDVETIDGGASLCRSEQSGKQAERGGLAGSVGSEQAEKLPGTADETDAIDGSNEAALSVAKGFREVFCYDQRETFGKVIKGRNRENGCC